MTDPSYTVLLLILGHLIGDFIMQSKETALRKSERTWTGWVHCTLHVISYSITVGIFATGMLLFPWQVFLAIALPHWLIDRYSLADKWLKLSGGRTFAAAYASTDKYREFDIAFTSIVYTVVDSTFHIFCLWLMAVKMGLL